MAKRPIIGSKSYFLTEKTIQEIIDRWKFSKDNRVSLIAKEFEISEYKANKIINDYLSSKK